MRNLNGSVGNTLRSGVITDTGVFVSHAAEQVPTAPENRPVNIAVPVILYLGNPI